MSLAQRTFEISILFICYNESRSRREADVTFEHHTLHGAEFTRERKVFGGGFVYSIYILPGMGASFVTEKGSRTAYTLASLSHSEGFSHHPSPHNKVP